MPTLRLTDAAIKKLKTPETGRIEYWDSHTRGLGLRVSSSSVRSWVLMTRALKNGAWKQQRVTLGNYPALSLAEARTKATEAKAAAKIGEDPAAATKEEKRVLVDDSRNTYASVRTDFLAKHRGRQNRRPAASTLREMERVLGCDDFKEWEGRPLAKITRRDVLDVLDKIIERGAEVAANRTLAYLRLMFKWALHRDIVREDVTSGIKKPGAERSRDRVLSPDEIRLIWRATGDANQFNLIVRLLLLTGQRLNEVAGMRWSEIDSEGQLWALPAARAKNHREHAIPLSPPAVAILEGRKAAQKAVATKERPQPPLVFTTTGKTPFSGFSKSKARLDRRMNKLLAQDHPDADPPPALVPWALHDLRRSVATRMAEDLRIGPHIIEAVLNHVSGSKAGVAGIYNRALHLDERREALEAWSRHLFAMVGEVEPGANVVAIRRAG